MQDEVKKNPVFEISRAIILITKDSVYNSDLDRLYEYIHLWYAYASIPKKNSLNGQADYTTHINYITNKFSLKLQYLFPSTPPLHLLTLLNQEL